MGPRVQQHLEDHKRFSIFSNPLGQADNGLIFLNSEALIVQNSVLFFSPQYLKFNKSIHLHMDLYMCINISICKWILNLYINWSRRSINGSRGFVAYCGLLFCLCYNSIQKHWRDTIYTHSAVLTSSSSSILFSMWSPFQCYLSQQLEDAVSFLRLLKAATVHVLVALLVSYEKCTHRWCGRRQQKSNHHQNVDQVYAV